jgi:Phytochelatin synthase
MRTRSVKILRLGMAGRLLAVSIAVLSFIGGGLFFLLPAQISQEAIRSSVMQEPAVIERAWMLPVAATFNQTVDWQSNASRCGPASIANVFRSLGESKQTESAVLAGTNWCWTGYCILGLTLDELAEVARTYPNRRVTVLRDLTPEEFLDHLRNSNDPSRRYIINFSRAHIFGTGVGHHSPIGGYLESEDLVFVLDVNRNYQPWLVKRSRLFSAMNTFDGEVKRGLLLIE